MVYQARHTKCQVFCVVFSPSLWVFCPSVWQWTSPYFLAHLKKEKIDAWFRQSFDKQFYWLTKWDKRQEQKKSEKVENGQRKADMMKHKSLVFKVATPFQLVFFGLILAHHKSKQQKHITAASLICFCWMKTTGQPPLSLQPLHIFSVFSYREGSGGLVKASLFSFSTITMGHAGK